MNLKGDSALWLKGMLAIFNIRIAAFRGAFSGHVRAMIQIGIRMARQ